MKALIFDLDGTLVDSTYGHVLAYQIAFSEAGMPVEAWRVHGYIGMSGDLLTKALARDSGTRASARKLHKIDQRHSELLHRLIVKPDPLPGAVELLKMLRQRRILHGIATSGERDDIKTAIQKLGVGRDTVIITRSDVARAKPEPDLFVECQKRLGVSPHECYAVGDAIWDILAARQAGMLGIGVLTGGRSQNELLQNGAYRVFVNAQDLNEHLGELGIF